MITDTSHLVQKVNVIRMQPVFIKVSNPGLTTTAHYRYNSTNDSNKKTFLLEEKIWIWVRSWAKVNWQQFPLS